jgi:hypothetical protein
MVRTTLGAEVETSVTVQGTESVDFINLDRTTTVAAGEQEEIILAPPTGFVYEILSARLTVPLISSSASSIHELNVSSQVAQIRVLSIQSDSTNRMDYARGFIRDGNQRKHPPTATAQTLAVRGIRASPQAGIAIVYRNFSSTDQTDLRKYRIAVRQIQVGEQ